MKSGNISIYRLAVQSGMDRGTIGKIVKGAQTPTWPLVERIAEGLGKIHPRWRGAFLYNLSLPDDAFPDTVPGDFAHPSLEESLEVLEEMEQKGLIFPSDWTHSRVLRAVQVMGIDELAAMQYNRTGIPGIRYTDDDLLLKGMPEGDLAEGKPAREKD